MNENEENTEQMASSSQIASSLWQTKPWWCQPWSIVLTGLTIPTTSWLLLHRLWITLPVTSAIALWWILFLGIVPAQYAATVESQKEQNMS